MEVQILHQYDPAIAYLKLLVIFAAYCLTRKRPKMLCVASIRLFNLAVVAFCILATSTSYADSFGSGNNTFDIDFVTIGNPGNPADTIAGSISAGSVDYTYRIGKYEISEDAIDKANTFGSLGITKDVRGVDKPATLSWNEAARFVNWLNTSTGSTRAYKFEFQPGEVGYSSDASIQLWGLGDAGFNAGNPFRNRQARYWLPSFDEWYKAAYYDPTSGAYFEYPTGSDTVPDGIDFPGDTTFDAVFIDGTSHNPNLNNITDVGVLSPYGTAGQGGNVSEWQETEIDFVNDLNFLPRWVLGGSFVSGPDHLRASQGLLSEPAFEHRIYGIGFRVASVPEPGAALPGSLALLGALMKRKR